MDSSRVSERGLVGSNLKFRKTGIMRKRKQKKNANVDAVIDGPQIHRSQNHQGEEPVEGEEVKRKDSENSKEGESEEKDGSLDHNKMLKDIKISNNKLNMVTLSVILIFLTYFSVCFGVSMNYLNQI